MRNQVVKKTSLLLVILTVLGLSASVAQNALLPDAPEVRSRHHVTRLSLHAVNVNGCDAFAFNDAAVPPLIRVSPGAILKIDYFNDLPLHSPEHCAVERCMDMTNLHFHGLAVSPNAPQDDVLDMMAKPGEVLHYEVRIPGDHPPGLFWYHTHPHGESHRQTLDGMSGAIVIAGMEGYVPEVRHLRERVLVVRGRSIEHDPRGDKLKRQVDVPPQKCGTGADEVDEIFTVNGTIRPRIEIAPGERKFWRIVNASADRYLDIQLDGTPLEIVALDGMPLAYHDPEHPTRTADHLLVVSAGRLEAIVTGPSAQAHAALRTLCVDTGPAGDNNPGMVLADLAFTQSESKGFKPPAARNGQSTPGLQTDEYRKIEEYGSGVHCSFHRRQERFLHQWLEVHSRRACDDQRSRGYISTLAHC